MAPRRPPRDPADLFGPSASGPDFAEEARLIAAGRGPVCGVDEAGRGPLCGPVVVAAVVLDPAAIPPGLDDSKKLAEAAREAAFAAVLEAALAVSVASAGPDAIARLNIRGATLDAMRRAVAGLALRPGTALVDGRDVPPGLPCRGLALVKGDARSLSVAAASIVAKVTRDRLMTRLDAAAPGYGLAANKGYGAPVHLAALRRLGLTRFHRAGFVHLDD